MCDMIYQTLEEELSRVLPVIKALRQHSSPAVRSIPISIDTYRAQVLWTSVLCLHVCVCVCVCVCVSLEWYDCAIGLTCRVRCFPSPGGGPGDGGWCQHRQ